MLDYYIDECKEVCAKCGQIDEWLYDDRAGVYLDDYGELMIKIGDKI